MRSALRIFATVLGAYLVVRGVVEFFTIDYGDPSSYRNDWGGPSLLGVLAVHSGPGLAILAWFGYRVESGRLFNR